MPKLIGGFAALFALAAGILNSVEPLTCIVRAALVFMLGSLATQLWYVFFTVRVTSVDIDELQASQGEVDDETETEEAA